MKSFVFQQWFLLALVMVLAVGIGYSRQLQPIADSVLLRDGIVVGVMICMSLPLQASVVGRTVRTPLPTLIAVVVTFGALPLMARALSGLLRGDLAPGLQVVAATPCTLASAAVWTRRAGGNEAVALLVTLLTNASCFLITPLWLWVMTGARVDDRPWNLGAASLQLALLVVLPIAAAQSARTSAPLAGWAQRHREGLSVAAQCGILAMIFLGAIRTGMRLAEQGAEVGLIDFAVMMLVVLMLHVSMLALGVGLGRLCRCAPADQIAIGFAGSQKTLMVGILMAISLRASILPMVAYHCLQLFVDTLIADAVRAKGEANQQTPSE